MDKELFTNTNIVVNLVVEIVNSKVLLKMTNGKDQK